ncbi:lamin tail domain-containing protein 2 isoform X2 [Sarcophilus harrisii]|uniref:Lamin tail domain containing 2 n=2 Tax=Sarcophilus harrisii TaxID=9305 RepID=G3VQN2_SARHA|nr:lamin tail domain-containing protein 2 isoform X2 [Sarcophilus harrisii]XP_031798385.1 lamin tail domain-containing protein 2 isoform X2 [Sarcophilus harrisii]
MAGQPAEPGEDGSSLEQLGSDLGQELKVHEPSWTISWPSFMWSSDGPEATESGPTPEGANKSNGSYGISRDSQHRLSEHLDPRVLRLLLAQRELEIQGLRKAAQCPSGKRMTYILHELTDSKPERTSRDQIRALQQQIEKMTQELQDQKKQACQEKMELQNQLQEANATLKRLEDELQSYQRSCLLHLARSSWAGRVLRSQTGSVEVVTAEALMMDLSDESLEQKSAEGRHFSLEDVDWNSVAKRYPNLFKDLYQKTRPASAHMLDLSELPGPQREKSGSQKTVDWKMPSSCLSSTASTSEGTITRHSSAPASVASDLSPSLTLPTQEQEGSSSGTQTAMEVWRPNVRMDSCSSARAAVVGIGSARLGSVPCSFRDHHRGRNSFGSPLRIVKIDKRGKFIRVLNESLEESVDISGYVLKQLIHQFPVCVYRFPKDTLLGPQHHVTVWGEGVSLTKKHVPQMQRQLIHFYTNPGCVTLLLNPKGQVMSEYQAQHSVTEASKSFDDHTDVSIDRYPLPEAEGKRSQEGPDLGSKNYRRQSRIRRKSRISGPSLDSQSGTYRSRPLIPIPSYDISKSFGQQEAREARVSRQSLHNTMMPLPSIPEMAQLSNIGKKMQEKGVSKGNHFLPPRICRKFVDVDCPMVALSVQKTSESRFGMKHLSYLPITTELREPL